MKRRQEGAALIVGLVLLTVSLLLGLSSVQSSRLEETMTGNQRSMELAYMASETGTSKFYDWLKNTTAWPSGSGDLTYSNDGQVGEYARYEIESACWGAPVSDPSSCVENYDAEHVTLWMKGLAERGEVVARLVSKYKQLPIPPHSAAYTCFDVYCSDTVSGNAELTGEDYHVPEVFDCEGNACIASQNEDAPTEYDAYYPDVPYENHPVVEDCSSHETDGSSYTICDNKFYGYNDAYGDQSNWYDFIDFIDGSGYDVELNTGDELSYNVGGRDDYDSSFSDSELEASGFWGSVSSKFIEVREGADVTVKASTNTLGVIVVREGAVLDYKGTSTHEGVILIEPGGTLKFSSGNPQVYGGIVALNSVNEDGEIISGELNISGNMGVHYSSLAWKLLSQGGKGVRLVAWYEDVSQ
ncbi:PilX N-terminal domain-containing pilus assembly protein [Halomonas rhizosphaerae]|uniref:PilX N-terminal domain-containing pilus assembly protein n=1 Tax=Halomonas rhizosphaerae TaxID=3043296 RepID=A0ABT6UWY5_9GAMM|nr:PilX N-terminal domain-containing pilus assembly protein [Halomonas rhizosphaerae]MDI5890436.1 PilX N-terminal domain-containing pilus assembly protein [Halomonas rhizosphaerae]